MMHYVDATCASVEKTINDMIDKMIENMKKRIAKYSHCFNWSRENYNEPDSSFRSPKSEVSLYHNFEPFYLVRHDLHDDLSLPSLEKRVISLYLYYKTLHPTLAHPWRSLMIP